MSLKIIHNRLLHQKAELNDRLARLRVDLTHNDTDSRATTELALEQENDEVSDRMAATTAVDLERVNAALSRLADGTYGRCELCGAVIEDQRLIALPLTTLCIKCAQLQPV